MSWTRVIPDVRFIMQITYNLNIIPVLLFIMYVSKRRNITDCAQNRDFIILIIWNITYSTATQQRSRGIWWPYKVRNVVLLTTITSPVNHPSTTRFQRRHEVLVDEQEWKYSAPRTRRSVGIRLKLVLYATLSGVFSVEMLLQSACNAVVLYLSLIHI